MSRQPRWHAIILALLWSAIIPIGGAAEPVPALDELLKEYQELGLPMPPNEAKLVRYESGGGGIVNRVVQPKTYSMAFEFKREGKTSQPVLWTGTHEWQSDRNVHVQELEPKPEAVKELELGPNDDLVMAIQCHARGWDKLAGYLLERSRKNNEVSARIQLVQLAWYFWEGHLTQPKSDRSVAAKRLKQVIKQDKELDTEYHRALLKSLDLALVPSKAKPGSIEALIDDLVDYQANSGTLGIYEPEDRYWRIAKLGFDAVPALIEHLDDDRLTRAMMVGFNNFRSWNMRVRDVVGDLLEGLAAEELMRGADGEDVGGGWLRRQQGYPITKVAAKQWWDKAKKAGEEPYLLDHVLPPATKENAHDVDSHLLSIVVVKYPKHIPALYRKVLDQRPDLQAGRLADALLRSKLPDKEKLDLFLHAADHKDKMQRLIVLYAIKELDKKKFNSLLFDAVENIPTDVPGPYWRCPEAYLARLAIESDDPKIWETLEKVAKRSELGLRMELLNHFGDPKENRHRPERLRLLASFLNDAVMRDEDSSSKFEGPGAGFPYHKIEVRNFVAIEISRILGIEVELNLERKPEDWAKIRSQVQDRLKELDKVK